MRNVKKLSYGAPSADQRRTGKRREGSAATAATIGVPVLVMSMRRFQGAKTGRLRATAAVAVLVAAVTMVELTAEMKAMVMEMRWVGCCTSRLSCRARCIRGYTGFTRCYC